MSRPIALLMAAAIASLGCADEGPPNPLPPPTDSPAAGGGPPTPGPFKRTVETRNPFGGPAGNLLVDGDFEFSTLIQPYSGQVGWRAFGNVGLVYLRMETGGLCRSGLRCGVLEGGGVVLFGQGASAKDSGMIASLWAKPPEGENCRVVYPTLIQCNFAGDLIPLGPDDIEPDADGWCHYRRALPRQSTSLCMYIDSNMLIGETALLDNATLLPDNGPVPRSAHKPASPERIARAQQVVRWVREQRIYGKPLRRRPPIGER